MSKMTDNHIADDGKMLLLQRAIESAKNRVYYIDVNSMGDISYHHHKKAENQKELMNITVEALEKQIPEKPIEDGYYDLPCVCPNCGSNVANEDSNDYQFKYCYHCGQALDWSDTK